MHVSERPLRVVVAEDSFLTRAGVVRVLENAGFAVVGEAVSYTHLTLPTTPYV